MQAPTASRGDQDPQNRQTIRRPRRSVMQINGACHCDSISFTAEIDTSRDAVPVARTAQSAPARHFGPSPPQPSASFTFAARRRASSRLGKTATAAQLHSALPGCRSYRRFPGPRGARSPNVAAYDPATFQREARVAAYLIAEHLIADAERFEQYRSKVAPMIERYGGRYLTRGGSHEVLDGKWNPTRAVIIEFPTWRRSKPGTNRPSTSRS